MAQRRRLVSLLAILVWFLLADALQATSVSITEPSGATTYYDLAPSVSCGGVAASGSGFIVKIVDAKGTVISSQYVMPYLVGNIWNWGCDLMSPGGVWPDGTFTLEATDSDVVISNMVSVTFKPDLN